MPRRERVQELITLVEQNKFIEALQEFYAENATMQENNEPPRVGLAKLIEHERKVMATFKEVNAKLVDTFFVHEDRVVIHWQFAFVRPPGPKLLLDELAYQLWHGDKVIWERFYYDPAQMRS